MACMWQDASPRIAEQLGLANGLFEADAPAAAGLGFVSMAPSGWVGNGTTIVLVSHDAALMRSLCDRVGWLDHGRLVEVGDPDHVIDAYLKHASQDEGDTLTARD